MEEALQDSLRAFNLVKEHHFVRATVHVALTHELIDFQGRVGKHRNLDGHLFIYLGQGLRTARAFWGARAPEHDDLRRGGEDCIEG